MLHSINQECWSGLLYEACQVKSPKGGLRKIVQTSFPALLTSTPPRESSSLEPKKKLHPWKKHKPGVLWSVACGMSRQADSRRCLNSPIIVQQLTWPPSVVGPMEPRRGELGVRRVPNNLLHSLSEQLEGPVRGDSCQSQVLFANLERGAKELGKWNLSAHHNDCDVQQWTWVHVSTRGVSGRPHQN